VNHHAGWLVDYGKVRVFIDNVERDVFGSSLEGRGMRLTGDGNLLTAAEFHGGLLTLAVDEDIALIHQEVNARAAYSVKVRGEEEVKALMG
jgi:hypothetical protein